TVMLPPPDSLMPVMVSGVALLIRRTSPPPLVALKVVTALGAVRGVVPAAEVVGGQALVMRPAAVSVGTASGGGWGGRPAGAARTGNNRGRGKGDAADVTYRDAAASGFVDAGDRQRGGGVGERDVAAGVGGVEAGDGVRRRAQVGAGRRGGGQ